MTQPKQKLKLKKQIDKCTVADHHISLRRRSSDTRVSFIDHLIVFSGPLIPIAVFIQAYDVWILGRVEGLSALTWSILTFAAGAMAAYAIYHRMKPLVMTYVPLVVADMLVVVGVVVLQ